MLKVGEIEVQEGMIEDIASEWRCDAEHLEKEMKRGGYGVEGGEERYHDDSAELCKLRITAEVMDEYLDLRSQLAAATAERDGLRETLTGIKSDIELDFMLDGEWVDNPSTLVKMCHEQAAKALAAPAATPITVTRISHPESNARPADAGEETP